MVYLAIFFLIFFFLFFFFPLKIFFFFFFFFLPVKTGVLHFLPSLKVLGEAYYSLWITWMLSSSFFYTIALATKCSLLTRSFAKEIR